MPRSIEIFVASEDSLEDFVKEVSSLLGSELSHYSNDDGTWYEFHTPHIRLAVWKHALINDRGMNFEDYKYQVSMWGIDDKDSASRERRRRDFGNSMYEKLKNTGKYRLMITDDVQQKLGEFDPKLDS